MTSLAERYGRYLKGDRDTETPLLHIAFMHAIDQGNVSMVRCLMELGVDPNCLDEDIPALHHAVRLSNDQRSRPEGRHIIDMLLIHGGDPSIVAKNESGESALHLAARSGNVDVVLDLLRFGADTRISDANGQSALFAAAKAAEDGVEEVDIDYIIRYMVLNGADADHKDNQGRQVVHIAAQRGLAVVMLRLVRNFGAQHNTKDKEGKTPLDYAREEKHEYAVQLLQSFSQQKQQSTR